MIARRAIAALLALAGFAAMAVVPASAGTSSYPPNKRVKVYDDYFAPAKTTVPRRTLVVWKWDSDNGNTHDVKLVRAPEGVKRFHSEPATADFRFGRRLRVRGTYKVLCTYHRLVMRQTIVVK